MRNQKGFGLVQAMLIAGVVSALSYVVMSALELNNRILQNVSTAKIIDDIVEDIYNRLKDPEMCAVDYYASRNFDDGADYSQNFNSRIFNNQLSDFPSSVATPGGKIISGRYFGFGNFFMEDTDSFKKNTANWRIRIPYILNRRGVETYRWTDDVKYIQLDNGGYIYSGIGETRNLDYDTDPGPSGAPANEYVAFWALPESLGLADLRTFMETSSNEPEKYLYGKKVLIKDIYLQNFEVVSGTQGTAELVFIFVKNYQPRKNDAGTDQGELGGRLTRRMIQITIDLFKRPTGSRSAPPVATPTTAPFTNTQIQKCFADRNNFIRTVTRQYCEENGGSYVGGSYVDGECRGFDEALLKSIRKKLCADMYGGTEASPTLWDTASGNCLFPECKYGITGFDSNGVPECLCGLENGDTGIVTMRTDGSGFGNCP